MYHGHANVNLMVENVIQIKSGRNDKYQCNCKKHICEKDYIWNPSTSSCKNNKYLASIIDISLITCDEFIEEETICHKYVRNNKPKKFCINNIL